LSAGGAGGQPGALRSNGHTEGQTATNADQAQASARGPFNVAAFAGALLIAAVGLVWAHLARLPLVVRTRGDHPLTKGSSGYRSTDTLVVPNGRKDSDEPEVRVRLERLVADTHELQVVVGVEFSAGFLTSIRRYNVGAGALEDEPVVVRDERTHQLRLSGADATLGAEVLMSLAGEVTQTFGLRWKVSDILGGMRGAMGPGNTQPGVMLGTLNLPTSHYPAAFPNDRYATSFWLSLASPNGHYFKSDSHTYSFQPSLRISCGPALRAWGVYARAGDGDQAGSRTVPAINVVIERGRAERLFTYVIHAVPIVLALALTLGVTFARVPLSSIDVTLRVASVYLSLVSLRTVAPGPGRSHGVTHADLLTLIAIAIVSWVLLVFLLEAIFLR
jgi:hypothetical protein